MKGGFSKPLQSLGSVGVTKDPPILGDSDVVPLSKNKHATLLHFCSLPTV